ncbi:MAG: 2-amino-4-hydroxy-6-hydroxymethyldihydropteridine diphosphokinase [Methylococcales bacterium]
MSSVYISIGSNVERESNVRKALKMLNQRFNTLHCSSIYETLPVGFSGALFYNLVAMFYTDLSPAEVVTTLKNIEDQCGRDRTQQKFSNRSVDLDLLLYDDLILKQGNVNIPRDEILHYAYVLEPLAEIVPQLKHPELGISYAQMWDNFDKHNENQQRIDGLLETLLTP